MRGLVLFAAQGCFIGRVPIAPGTFGSLLGLLWFAGLLATGSFWLYFCGCVLGVAGSVWICDQAERILGQPDPSSVVLDEIVAVPICFAGGLALYAGQHGRMPQPQLLLTSHAALLITGVFIAFRFFDILKPWPIRQSQRLPGGWGITVDDVLAAVYVNVVLGAIWGGKELWSS